MNERDLAASQNSPAANVSGKPVGMTRNRFFKIWSNRPAQYDAILGAYDRAPEMPIEQIAKAAVSIGDHVKEVKVDAHIKEGWEQGGTLVRQGERRFLMRETGDRIDVAPLTSPDTDPEASISSQTTDIPSFEKPSNNIEGVGVYPFKQPGINDAPDYDAERVSNPFANAPAVNYTTSADTFSEPKKAA